MVTLRVMVAAMLKMGVMLRVMAMAMEIVMAMAMTKHRTFWNSSACKSAIICKIFIDNVISFSYSCTCYWESQ